MRSFSVRRDALVPENVAMIDVSKLLLSLSILVGVGVGVVAGCGGASDDACIPGHDCTCADEPACDDSCDGANCAYTCKDTKSCHFECTDGGCSVSASNAGAVTLDCAGGGCQMACSGSTSCKITGCSDCVCTDDTSVSGLCAP